MPSKGGICGVRSAQKPYNCLYSTVLVLYCTALRLGRRKCDDSEKSARSRFQPPADPSNVLYCTVTVIMLSVPRPALCTIPTKGMKEAFPSPISSNSERGFTRNKVGVGVKCLVLDPFMGVVAKVGVSGPDQRKHIIGDGDCERCPKQI